VLLAIAKFAIEGGLPRHHDSVAFPWNLTRRGWKVPAWLFDLWDGCSEVSATAAIYADLNPGFQFQRHQLAPLHSSGFGALKIATEFIDFLQHCCQNSGNMMEMP
jgi:hypothetical protein